MSKQTFSEKTKEIIEQKINALESLDLEQLLKKDEEFEFILSLAYMTLSKEKIIKKDIKNQDRLGRLTKLVEQKEIDKVFDNNYISETPNIINTIENSNLWILDNIRDSIMHGSFEIDEENKLILIDNQEHNRNLKTEIPFTWFIEYAKNDILKKKISNEYTVNGFYRNKNKSKKRRIKTEFEIKNNIPYYVKISGITFNINEMENRIRELYKEYSKNEYEETNLDNLEKYKTLYHKNYLMSFHSSSLKVKETLEKEYPGIIVKIGIKDRTETKNIIKGCPEYYINYDLMIDEFERKLSKKGISLLTYLENIITKEYNDLSNLQLKEKLNIINELVNNEKQENKLDIKQLYESSEKILKSLLINVYGITTLVTNQETLYNPCFLNQTPEEYSIYAIDKNTYIEDANKKRVLEIKILELEIIIKKLKEQKNNCKDKTIQQKLENKIKIKEQEQNTLTQELYKLAQEMDYRIVLKATKDDYIKKAQLEQDINILYKEFKIKKDLETKKKLNQLMIQYIEETSKYTFEKTKTMKETLTTIRNCFSHIGRITIGNEHQKNLKLYRTMYLTDYDNNNEISGIIICKYEDMINILKTPYEKNTKKKLTKTKNNI